MNVIVKVRYFRDEEKPYFHCIGAIQNFLREWVSDLSFPLVKMNAVPF